MNRIVKGSLLLVAFVAVAGVSTFFTLTFLIQRENTVVVPDLVNKEVVYALQILTDLGLNAKIKGSEHSSSTPLNHIVHQEPGPGSKIKQNRDVRFVVSKGEKRVQVPRLTGLSIQKTRIVLETHDLCQGNLARTYDDRAKAEDVIAQNPGPPAMVDRGVCVDLLVSLGSRPTAYMMPVLSGQVFENAVIEVEKRHLTLGEIKATYHEDQPKNTIVGQNPPSGFRIVEGDPVTLERNIPTHRQAVSPLQATQGVNLFRYRIKSGFLKSRIRVRISSYGMTNDLIDDFKKPGEEVWILIPKGVHARLTLFEDEEQQISKTFEAW